MKRKTIMQWALYSTEGGFFTQLAPAMTTDGDAKIIARTTRNPMDPAVMTFPSHAAMENLVDAVEAAMAIPLAESLTEGRSPFAKFVEVRVPRTIEVPVYPSEYEPEP